MRPRSRSASFTAKRPWPVVTVTVASAGAWSVTRSTATCACWVVAVPTLKWAPSTSAFGPDRSTSTATTRPEETLTSPSHSVGRSSFSPSMISRPTRPAGIAIGSPGPGPCPVTSRAREAPRRPRARGA